MQLFEYIQALKPAHLLPKFQRLIKFKQIHSLKSYLTCFLTNTENLFLPIAKESIWQSVFNVQFVWLIERLTTWLKSSKYEIYI